MKTIVLEEPGLFVQKETPKPASPGPGEALLKVKKIGVCGTDIHAFGGNQPFFNYPRVLGHELAVEVMETGADVENVKAGDTCTVEPYYNPSSGQAVEMGKPNCGDHLRVLGVHEDGGMREQIIYQAKYLHRSSTLKLDQLALIEPLAIGCHAVDRGELNSDDIVLVIGAGPIGLGVLQFAKLSGARVVMMDINEKRLQFCEKTSGSTETINAADNPKEKLKDLLDGYLPTVIFDATGNTKSMINTFDYAAPAAVVVFVGLVQGEITFNDPEFHKKELTLKATRAALSRDFSRIIRLVEAGLIDPLPWITRRIKFDDVVDKFESVGNTDLLTIKAIIDLDYIL